jgi:hypothetical protein
MAVNISKTKFIIFHTRGKIIDNDNIMLTYNDNEPGENDPSRIFTIERFHNNHASLEKRSYKLLGIHLDEHLSLDHHVKLLCNKLNRSLFCINRAKNFLTPKALLTLYYALIHSHLTYCPIIVGCAQQHNKKKITTIQKKAIRTITNKRAREHTEPLFNRLKILTYEKIIAQAKLKFMHAVHHNYAPSSFRNTWLLNHERNPENNLNLRDDNLYAIPHPRIELFKKSPIYSLPKVWNDLSINIRGQHNKTTFSIALKNHLLEQGEQ